MQHTKNALNDEQLSSKSAFVEWKEKKHLESTFNHILNIKTQTDDDDDEEDDDDDDDYEHQKRLNNSIDEQPLEL